MLPSLPPRVIASGSFVRARIATKPSAPASASDGILLTFKVGAGQAATWIEHAVVGLEEGSAKSVASPPGGSVYVVAVILAVAEVSPKKLPGVSDVTLRRIEIVDALNAADKTRRRRSEKGEGAKEDAVVDLQKLSPLQRAEKARKDANEMVMDSTDTMGKGRKRLREAIILYNRALHWSVLGGGGSCDPEFAAKVLGNIALVLGMLQEWKAVLLYCAAVLEIDTTSLKAVFRRGQACARMRIWVGSERWLAKALEIKPGDEASTRELEDARKENVALLRKTRKGFSETYSCSLLSSPIYKVIEEEDLRTKDTGSLSGFAKGFMG